MPSFVTLLDLILLAIMLISGLLAMIRGFMREVLSIASWAAAALVTLYFYKRAMPSRSSISPINTSRWAWWSARCSSEH